MTDRVGRGTRKGANGWSEAVPRALSRFLLVERIMEHAASQAFALFNLCEGVLWLAVSVGILVVLWQKRQDPAVTILLAILFATYGISDWVEIYTGGWYKPWWMFAWKASNLSGLAATLFWLRRRAMHGQAARWPGVVGRDDVGHRL